MKWRAAPAIGGSYSPTYHLIRGIVSAPAPAPAPKTAAAAATPPPTPTPTPTPHPSNVGALCLDLDSSRLRDNCNEKTGVNLRHEAATLPCCAVQNVEGMDGGKHR